MEIPVTKGGMRRTRVNFLSPVPFPVWTSAAARQWARSRGHVPGASCPLTLQPCGLECVHVSGPVLAGGQVGQIMVPRTAGHREGLSRSPR